MVGDQLTQISPEHSTKAVGIKIPLIQAKVFWLFILIRHIGIPKTFVTDPFLIPFQAVALPCDLSSS